MEPTNKIDTARTPVSTAAASILQFDECMIEPPDGEMDRVSSRREWIRTGVRTVVLLGLGGMICLLLGRTGRDKPCFRAGCRNCPQLSNCQVRFATMIHPGGTFPTKKGAGL